MLLTVACGTDSTGNVIIETKGQPHIIAEGFLEATVDTDVWPGEVSSIDFDAAGVKETVTVTAKRSVTISEGDSDIEETMIIKIHSNEGEILMEQDYSGSNVEITLDEWGADLPEERWVSSSGNVEIIELSDFYLQVRFNAIMRLKKDLDEGNTDGDILFIEDGKFNKALELSGGPDEERVTF